VEEPQEDVHRLLVVDDEDLARIQLVHLLTAHGYVCDEAVSAAEALKFLDSDDSYLAALCDIEMLGESGIELLRNISSDHPDVAVIMTTGVDDPATAEIAFEVGAYGYLLKPISLNQMLITLTGALRRREFERAREERYRSGGLEVARSRALASVLRVFDGDITDETASLGMIEMLSRVVSLRGEETGQHIERMSRYAANLAAKVGFSDLSWDDFRKAAALHDVGKIGVPHTILLKPARLSSDQRILLQRHTLIGFQLLQGAPTNALKAAASIALYHHERWDGNGYPHGLRGEEIPWEARITAIADVFDALTCHRVYKSAVDVDAALDMMSEQRGRHFDPNALDAFMTSRKSIMAVREEYPDSVPEPRIRVLTVDDHDMFVESLGRLLASQPEVHLVGSAGSVAAAIEATSAYLPDVVLMDYELPDGDGAKAIRAIKALDPRVKVVMLTCRSDQNALTRAVEAGASGFVNKTESVKDLIRAIVAAYQGEIPEQFAELREVFGKMSRTERGIGLDLRPREHEVLQLMALGLSNLQIAEKLYISPNTVSNHTHNIFEKLDVHSKLEAVATAMREGILTGNVYRSDLSA
jgi:putative two-component system response regulator